MDYPRNTESSFARNLQPNLTKFINDGKTPKIKGSWKSENYEIHYNVRTPKANIGLRLTKSYKKGFLQNSLIIY